MGLGPTGPGRSAPAPRRAMCRGLLQVCVFLARSFSLARTRTLSASSSFSLSRKHTHALSLLLSLSRSLYVSPYLTLSLDFSPRSLLVLRGDPPPGAAEWAPAQDGLPQPQIYERTGGCLVNICQVQGAAQPQTPAPQSLVCALIWEDRFLLSASGNENCYMNAFMVLDRIVW